MKKLICLLILVTLVGGCATTLDPKMAPPIENSRIFNLPFDTVWNATIKYLVNSGEFITNSDKDSGFISFQSNLTDKEWTEYVYFTPMLGYSHVKANINISLLEIDAIQTKVSIYTKIACVGARTVRLTSKGILEKKYLDGIVALISN